MRSRNGPKEKLLLVEGAEDFHTVLNLLEVYNVPIGFTVEDGDGFEADGHEANGYEAIVSGLRTRIKLSNETHLGVLVDADKDMVTRWQSLSGVLKASGYDDICELPNEDGTIIVQQGLPKIGIWIMPDNRSHGMLEDFARLLLPLEDRLWDRAAAAVAAIPEDERLFRGVHESKARIHTWLAWQKEPGKPIGQAIKIGYLDGKTDVAQRLVDWMVRLFDLTP